MVRDRRVRSPAASAEGRQPSCSAAAMTRSATASVTMPRVAGFKARETVDGCTPAARATSVMVVRGDRPRFGLSGGDGIRGFSLASAGTAKEMPVLTPMCNRLH